MGAFSSSITIFVEDNEAVVKICRPGNSQKLMHLPRTHRVDAAFIAECTHELAVCKMGHTHTDNQAADICTKRFTDPPKWLKLLYLINVVTDPFGTPPRFLDIYTTFSFGATFLTDQGGIFSRLGPCPFLSSHHVFPLPPF